MVKVPKLLPLLQTEASRDTMVSPSKAIRTPYTPKPVTSERSQDVNCMREAHCAKYLGTTPTAIWKGLWITYSEMQPHGLANVQSQVMAVARLQPRVGRQPATRRGTFSITARK